MTAPETKERAEVAGWRNWWRALRDHHGVYPSGKIVPLRDGDMFPSETVFPSKAAAEQTHIDMLRNEPEYGLRRGSAHYLGAYPEGETP